MLSVSIRINAQRIHAKTQGKKKRRRENQGILVCFRFDMTAPPRGDAHQTSATVSLSLHTG